MSGNKDTFMRDVSLDPEDDTGIRPPSPFRTWAEYEASHGGMMTQPQVGRNRTVLGPASTPDAFLAEPEPTRPTTRSQTQGRAQGLIQSPTEASPRRRRQVRFDPGFQAPPRARLNLPLEAELTEYDDPRKGIMDHPRQIGESKAQWEMRVKYTHQNMGFMSKPSILTNQEALNHEETQGLKFTKPHEARTRLKRKIETQHARKMNPKRGEYDETYTERWYAEKKIRQEHNAEIDRQLLERMRAWQARTGQAREPTPDPAEDSGDAYYTDVYEFNGYEGSIAPIACLSCQRNRRQCSMHKGDTAPCTQCVAYETTSSCKPIAAVPRMRGTTPNSVYKKTEFPDADFEPATKRPNYPRPPKGSSATVERGTTPKSATKKTPKWLAKVLEKEAIPKSTVPKSEPKKRGPKSAPPKTDTPRRSTRKSAAPKNTTLRKPTQGTAEPEGQGAQEAGEPYNRCANCVAENRMCDPHRPCHDCLMFGEAHLCDGKFDQNDNRAEAEVMDYEVNDPYPNDNQPYLGENPAPEYGYFDAEYKATMAARRELQQAEERNIDPLLRDADPNQVFNVLTDEQLQLASVYDIPGQEHQGRALQPYGPYPEENNTPAVATGNEQNPPGSQFVSPFDVEEFFDLEQYSGEVQFSDEELDEEVTMRNEAEDRFLDAFVETGIDPRLVNYQSNLQAAGRAPSTQPRSRRNLGGTDGVQDETESENEGQGESQDESHNEGESIAQRRAGLETDIAQLYNTINLGPDGSVLDDDVADHLP